MLSGIVAKPAVDAATVKILEEVDKRLEPIFKSLNFLQEEARDARERAEAEAREARADRKADREARERAEAELRRRLDDLQRLMTELLAPRQRNG